MKFKLHTDTCELLTDTMTPVNMYLKIRDRFPNSVLLESSDYGANDNSVAYICFNAIAEVKLQNGLLTCRYPDGKTTLENVDPQAKIADRISAFAKCFEGDFSGDRFVSNGLFGFTSYEAVQYFEDISLTKKEADVDIPDLYYALFKM